jgi:hypothetical protein
MEQPRCPATDQWIEKIRYLYTIDFYSATKKKENLSFTVNVKNWRTSS